MQQNIDYVALAAFEFEQCGRSEQWEGGIEVWTFNNVCEWSTAMGGSMRTIYFFLLVLTFTSAITSCGAASCCTAAVGTSLSEGGLV